MDYVRAAQPRVVALFTLTVLAAMLLAGWPGATTALVVLAATALTVAGATVLNNHIERDLDRQMARTRERPTASGTISTRGALVAGLGAVTGGALALWVAAGWPAALLAAAGAAYYVVIYTLLLKPRTALSSVPGAVAGIFPALVGWTATGAEPDGALLYVCALIVVWSPPHFWALALARDDDYRASGVPTPATRYGAQATRRLIAAFVAALTAVAVAPAATGLFGAAYLLAAMASLGALWYLTLRLMTARTTAAAWLLFKGTGPCLALLLAAAVADTLA